MADPPKPPLLTAGILLTATRSVLCLFLIVIVVLAVTLGSGVGALTAHGDDWVPYLLLGGVVGVGGFLFALLHLCVLAVCAGAWFASLWCLWILIALSSLGLLSPGLIKTPISVVTLVGCIQALERHRPAHRTSPTESP